MNLQYLGRRQKVAEILSHSAEETERIGSELAQCLTIPGVVFLRGALGTGKTTLTRGIARGLGVEDYHQVNSPSFTIVNIYHGICPIYHVDLYRLQVPRDLLSIGLDDFLGTDGVTVVEWGEKIQHYTGSFVQVEIKDLGDDLRMLHIKFPERYKRSRRKSRARPLQ